MELVSPFAGKLPEPPKIPFFQFILNTVQNVLDTQGDRDFAVDMCTDHRVRYSELEPTSRKVASALTKHGFRNQDTLIFMTDNSCELYNIFLGVMRLNGILRPCYPQDLEETVSSRLQDSECRHVVCDRKTASTVKAACKNVQWTVKIYCFDEVDGCLSTSELFDDDGSAFPENVKVDLNDTVSLLCTGGTTGPSKGSCNTHLNYLYMFACNPYTMLPKVTNGKVLIAGRLFHLSGFSTVWASISQGATTLIMSHPSKENILKGIQNYKPSLVHGFISTAMWCVDKQDYDLSSVDTLALGAAPVTPSMQKQLKAAFPNCKNVHRIYGSTEGLLSLMTWNPTDVPEGPTPEITGTPDRSIGKLIPYTKLKIIDVETGEVLPANRKGIFYFKSPTNFKGYFKRPDATSGAIIDGWFNTGDYGSYDDNGFVYIIDRFKEVFKYWGNHISPVEIEEVIVRHQDVAEACVIGVPDLEGGAEGIPRAFIVRKTGSTLDEDTIKEFVHAQVESYKQLRGGVKFLDVMPKTNAGKMSRALMMKLYKEGSI